MNPVSITQPIQTPPSLMLSVQYAVRGAGGWIPLYRTGDSFKCDKGGYLCTDMNAVFVPVDPFTALRCGAVTLDELDLPEGLKALFNLLK